MYNVAIVEDETVEAETLKNLLARYSQEKNIEFNIVHYPDGMKFMWNFKHNFDIIFMDICLPEKNGIDIAAELRKTDKTVVLIFVSNMAQFAVKGYEVEALDYIVKPLTYAGFSLKMNRAVNKIKNSVDKEIVLKNETGMMRIKISCLTYVEIAKHRITYHTTDGNFSSSGTLTAVEAEIADSAFVRCNSCYLVNLRHVKSVNGNTVTVGNDDLQISHPRRKEFLKAVNNYFGGGGNA